MVWLVMRQNPALRHTHPPSRRSSVGSIAAAAMRPLMHAAWIPGTKPADVLDLVRFVMAVAHGGPMLSRGEGTLYERLGAVDKLNVDCTTTAPT